MAKRLLWCCLLWAASVEAQGEPICYGPGSMAASVILTFLVALLLLLAAWYWWKKYKSKSEQLILETDAEKGKGDYAFDNPGFKDSSLLQVSKNPSENQKQDGGKSKWNQWSPLAALTTKSEKKKTQDDTAVDEYEVKVIALRSHDFTGLGFNICGNMKEGIFVKDILHRGPAFESGKLNPGDRIHSVTISFEHMVYEDALTILSYASPYEVMIEAKSGRLQYNTAGQGGRPSHPVYRSSSCIDLYHKPSKKRLFAEDSSQGGSSNYSSLQKSKSNMTTLERKESKSPKIAMKPKPPQQPDHHHVQKIENKYQKFGVRVLPAEQQLQQQQRKSPKVVEQNDNNVNIEKQHGDVVLSIDEVDNKVVQPPPKAKKREKKPPSPTFERDGSGIRRDENGIPQEIPSHMLNAAVVARNNRKTVDDEDEEAPKRKGKAPSPPEDSPQVEKPYNSDSDGENDSSVNTIELNSSDITVHQSEEAAKEDQNRQDRKTVSTGDLTRIKKTVKSGTLERAQSLDISDPTPKKRDENDVFVVLDKEPRLSLILDGLNTFQRNRLKKSTEWGNLEDAILKLNQDDDSIVSVEDKSSLDRISLTEKTPEFDAVVNKINEIKRESGVENEIWPSIIQAAAVQATKEDKPSTPPSPPPPLDEDDDQAPPAYERRQQMTATSSPQPLHLVHNNINEPFEDVAAVIDDRTSLRQRLPDSSIPPPPGSDKPEWTITDTSPPGSLELEEPPVASRPPVKPEEVLSKIPLLSSMVEASKRPALGDNSTDESKTNARPNLQDVTESFLFTEQMNCSRDGYRRSYDMNVSDDMKVSRHSLGTQSEPKSDDDKSERHVSNVNVTNGDSELHSLELSINEEPYLEDNSIKDSSRVTISTPDLIKNVTLAEALSTLNDDYLGEKVLMSESPPSEDNSTLTYITEIKVTPNNGTRTTTTVTRTNVSEVEVNGRSLEKDFENYVRNFETKLEQFESNIQSFDKNLDEFIGDEVVVEQKVPEEEVHKIQEIAEEQLKKLPEMRFTTSTYTEPKNGREGPSSEKRQSQIELLRSNFEKSPGSPRPPKPESIKSRIPIATTAIKTPPTSPERRDSRSLDLEHDRAILELMSSPKKNVTVTSIRNNSKIPSGLPVLRPPVAPRRPPEGHPPPQEGNVVHVNESTFKQWVFNPANVTNVSVVAETKEK